LSLGLVEVAGHVAYDLGAVGVFQDIPVSLHVFVRTEFLNITGSNNSGGTSSNTSSNTSLNTSSFPTTTATTASKYDHFSGKPPKITHHNSQYSPAIIEAANELLLWLIEGEPALVASRQQKAKEKELKDKAAKEREKEKEKEKLKERIGTTQTTATTTISSASSSSLSTKSENSNLYNDTDNGSNMESTSDAITTAESIDVDAAGLIEGSSSF
jgi:hypothetical protein